MVILGNIKDLFETDGISFQCGKTDGGNANAVGFTSVEERKAPNTM